MHSKITALTISFLLFLLGACDGKGGTESDSASASGATTEATTMDTTSSTGGEQPTSTAASEDTTTAATEDTTGGASGETETTSAAEPDISGLCQASCEYDIACGVDLDVPECVAECSGNFDGLTDDCVDTLASLITCVNGLSCRDSHGSLKDTPCYELRVASELCFGEEPVDPDCLGSIDFEDVNCAVNLECPDAPTQSFVCDADVCTCLIGDMEVGQCPSENVCIDGDVALKQEECCPFG
ncbi:hypothetical protein [Nannocystis punicea]|uniref:Uncharacterized protein n=1 Tax=Nannocystis punicea TaxID=2995304 RepID=A0ABY7GW09_9BACT|nr:hypothetical protein [Nannocystis poenicansa]WAS91168.1 hypothetical protein O0S08_33695 [Nannocystis poenicansa]